MLAKLTALFAGAPQEADEAKRRRLAVVACAVLLEIAECDESFDEPERETIVADVRRRFDVDDATARAIMAQARIERGKATDYWEFTTEVNRRFSVDEKKEILETAWRVVFADGAVHRYEEALMRRLTSLLRLTHGEMIETKKKARGRR